MRLPVFKHINNLGIGARITLGCMLLVGLVALGSWQANVGLERTQINLAQYKTLSAVASQSVEIDRDVVELQRTVQAFTHTGQPGIGIQARDKIKKLQAQLEVALDTPHAETARDLLLQIQSHHKTYGQTFETMLEDRELRKRLVDDVLRATEAQTFATMMQTQQRIDSMDNEALTPHTQGVLYNLLQAQSGAELFLNAPDSVQIKATKSYLAKAKQEAIQLQSLAPTAELAKTMTGVVDTIGELEKAFVRVSAATRGYLYLTNVVMAGEAAETRNLAAELRTQTDDALMALQQNMAQETNGYKAAANWSIFASLIAGVLISWGLARGLSKPVIAITQTFSHLAAGRIDAQIPGKDRGDEIGQMAHAAQVFSDQNKQTQSLLEESQKLTRQMELANKKLSLEIQQREDAERSLEESVKAAQSAAQSKGEFLANMSHEIRTPMTAILGYTRLLATNTQHPEQLGFIQTIQRNGDHLLEIINDILDQAKIDSGQIEIMPEPVQLNQLVAEIASLMRVRTHEKDLFLMVRFDTPIPKFVLTDPMRLRQILMNLVGNAVKFTEDGGITIAVSYAQHKHKPVVQIQVQDTGPGVAPEDAARLFDAFCQGDGSMSRRYGGTGLGLTISKRLSQLLGGDLTLDTATQQPFGHGATFTITIDPGNVDNVEIVTIDHEILEPAPGNSPENNPENNPDPAPASTIRTLRATAESEAAIQRLAKTSAADTPPQPATRQPQTTRVLLAEDCADNQRLIKTLLSLEGIDVTPVSNGQEAYDTATQAAANNEPFDVVLMDMQMPVLDGYEAARLLRTNGYNGAIVALTAHVMAGEREKCVQAGCDNYATKPIVLDQLLSVIHQHTPPKVA